MQDATLHSTAFAPDQNSKPTTSFWPKLTGEITASKVLFFQAMRVLQPTNSRDLRTPFQPWTEPDTNSISTKVWSKTSVRSLWSVLWSPLLLFQDHSLAFSTRNQPPEIKASPKWVWHLLQLPAALLLGYHLAICSPSALACLPLSGNGTSTNLS